MNASSIGEVKKSIETELGKVSADYKVEAEIILSEITGKRRSELFLHAGQTLSPSETAKVDDIVRRRQKREPLQYILGKAWFRNLELTVGPGVLIPRPETELLVDIVLAYLEGQGSRVKGQENAGSPVRTLKVVDVGTGSGAIALSIASEEPAARVTAIDISDKALAFARKNSEKMDISKKVRFLQGNLLDPVIHESFDVVVANLPYIAEEELAGLQEEVKREPVDALAGGPDGLRIIDKLIKQTEICLSPGGLIALEIGAVQAGNAAALLSEASMAEVRITRDYAGIERFVSALKSNG